MRILVGIIFIVLNLSISGIALSAEPVGPPLDLIKLPPGFTISVYASGLAGARSLALGPEGIVLVGTRKEGNIYALFDQDKDGKAEETVIVAKGMNQPNGLVFAGETLFAAEISRILSFPDFTELLTGKASPKVIYDGLPKDRAHGWKYLRMGPDGFLYFGVGAPCNICLSDDPRYATIMRISKEGGPPEIFAHGVRNSVGFDWDPSTGELWFTSNGRDMMGDDLPPDTLNHAPTKGLHFGYPFCHAGDIPDPVFGAKRACNEFRPPAVKLGPHVASLGMKFYNGSMFPPEYQGSIFIAEHGSWNRSIPIGYRLTQIMFDGDKNMTYEVFASGWLQNGRAWGRPVDVLVMPDGSLLVSDDKLGAVYRISYKKKA